MSFRGKNEKAQISRSFQHLQSLSLFQANPRQIEVKRFVVFIFGRDLEAKTNFQLFISEI